MLYGARELEDQSFSFVSDAATLEYKGHCDAPGCVVISSLIILHLRIPIDSLLRISLSYCES